MLPEKEWHGDLKRISMIGKNIEFSCQRPAIWQNTEEDA